MTGSKHESVATSATGAAFVPLLTAFCRAVKIYNDTGTTLEVQQSGTGVAVPIGDGVTDVFEGLTNSNELGVRRKDQSNASVTVKYRWEFR